MREEEKKSTKIKTYRRWKNGKLKQTKTPKKKRYTKLKKNESNIRKKR